MEFQHINELEKATRRGQHELFRLGIGLLFFVGVMLYVSVQGAGQGSMMLVIASVLGGYMAMNIGANDVANNVGPAVGAKALTLAGALLLAAAFEVAGALIAGGDVVETIRSGIIDQDRAGSGDAFIWLMMSALLAGALWINIATAMGAPVSTTHSIVGAVLGAGVAAGGLDTANWFKMGTIAASWVVSPVLGGVVAAGFLYFIKRTITYKPDMVAAGRRLVPLLVAIMAWAFSTYLILKGLNKIWEVDFLDAALVGLVAGVVSYLLVGPVAANKRLTGATAKQSVNQLFATPLIFSAALLSFAHGANDVANAVGPLAAIADVIVHGGGQVGQKTTIPLWAMVVGALGIAVGLGLYGPKVIRTIGSEITELDQMRAYCIAMSAAITVIIASQLGLPVSSTHIVVGSVFGVGFLREYLKSNYARILGEIKAHHAEDDQAAIDAFMARFQPASIEEKGRLLAELKEQAKRSRDPAHFSRMERKGLKKIYRHELVRRSQLLRIAAAWVITVPASAIMAGLIYYMIRGMLTG